MISGTDILDKTTVCLTQYTFLLQHQFMQQYTSTGAEQALLSAYMPNVCVIPCKRYWLAFKVVMSKLYKLWYRPQGNEQASVHTWTPHMAF